MFKCLKAVTALKLSGDRTGQDTHTHTRTQPFIVKDCISWKSGARIQPNSICTSRITGTLAIIVVMSLHYHNIHSLFTK